jgi:hypothetical protein
LLKAAPLIVNKSLGNSSAGSSWIAPTQSPLTAAKSAQLARPNGDRCATEPDIHPLRVRSAAHFYQTSLFFDGGTILAGAGALPFLGFG